MVRGPAVVAIVIATETVIGASVGVVAVVGTETAIEAIVGVAVVAVIGTIGVRVVVGHAGSAATAESAKSAVIEKIVVDDAVAVIVTIAPLARSALLVAHALGTRTRKLVSSPRQECLK